MIYELHLEFNNAHSGEKFPSQFRLGVHHRAVKMRTPLIYGSSVEVPNAGDDCRTQIYTHFTPSINFLKPNCSSRELYIITHQSICIYFKK
jgi:hypothetical protein